MTLQKMPCPCCGKSVTKKNMNRHILTHNTKSYMNDENHINAIKNGLKNTTNCINYQRSRSTLLSLDSDIYRPFNAYKIADLNKAKEIRACGKPFSLYQEDRTYFNRNKIHWIDEAEHGNPTYVPKNLLDRAIADGINL